MTVYESRHDDGVGGVDHLCVARFEIGPDRSDLASFDQDVGLVVVPVCGIEGEDGASLDQSAWFGH